MTDVRLGLDVGSTNVKVLAFDDAGAQLASARRPTPWTDLGDGRTETTVPALLGSIEQVLDEVARSLADDVDVVSVGVCGMAEAGALLDGDDPVLPVPAWFDPRGAEEVAALPAGLRRAIPRRTGLPAGPLMTFAKLLHHRASGVDLRGKQWLNVAELVAWGLGGDRATEGSLFTRTGLLDLDTGEVWDEALDALGATADLLPPVRPAGTPWGRVTRLAPERLHGAVVTVAGHDHLVASASVGVLRPTQLYDSMGTAEALVRVLADPLDADARERLATHQINVGRHLLPGRSSMLAGTKSGLLMRRVLQLVGVGDDAGRDALDGAVVELGDDPAVLRSLRVSGAANDDGVLAVRADGDGLGPAALLAATLDHGARLIADTVARMDAETTPATECVVAGGWTQMASVRRSRAAVLPSVTFAELEEATGLGAALVGAFAADDDADDLAAYLAEHGLA